MKVTGLLLFVCAVISRTTALTGTACEHRTLSINCGSSSTIDIVDASYGRSDRSTCPHSAIHTTSCDAVTSNTVVRRECQGKHSCTVRASNSVFGDPCSGTYKYLRVQYNCRHTSSPTVNVCENRRQTISCPAGKAIDIIHAVYGRSDRSTCPHSAIHTTSCAAGNSERIVKANCNGRSSCTLHASNSVFTDPCVGTHKYLTVQYRCIDSPSRETSICEGRSSAIGCPVGQRIQIVQAIYGRTSTTICPHRQDGNTNCRRNALTTVGNICNGQAFCNLRASNSVYGDPCVGIYKYLFVRHNCIN